MKRTAIVVFALTMLLAWSVTAMSLPAPDEFYYLDQNAERYCHPTDRELWFDQGQAEPNRIAVFPYFAAVEDGFWSGMALVNKSEDYTIQPNTLCIVAYDGRDGAVKRVSGPVYPRNMFVTLVDELGADEVWENRVYVGVYARNADALKKAEALGNQAENAIEKFAGFAMMGNGAEGQGYFVNNRKSWQLEFNYVTEGSPWWRGLAIVNVTDESEFVKISVFQGDTATSEVVEIRRGEIWTGLVDDMEGVDAGKRAFIVAEEVANRDGDAKAPGARNNALMGFAMFGNGNEALGYLPDADVDLII